MAKGMHAFVSHDFYCIKCGKKGLPCYRKKSHQHSKGHLKKLYCIYCNEEVNHYECYSLDDVEKFQKKFKKGVFKEWLKS